VLFRGLSRRIIGHMNAEIGVLALKVAVRCRCSRPLIVVDDGRTCIVLPASSAVSGPPVTSDYFPRGGCPVALLDVGFGHVDLG